MPPLAQLTAISLWDTSDDDGWDFVMTVDVNPLVRLASLTVLIHPFTKLGHGPSAARAVLNELLAERDLLVSRLARSIPG